MSNESLNLNHAPDNCGGLSVAANGEVLTVADLARQTGMNTDWLYTVILCGARVRGKYYTFVKPPIRMADAKRLEVTV